MSLLDCEKVRCEICGQIMSGKQAPIHHMVSHDEDELTFKDISKEKDIVGEL